ncbi:MAG TPA: biotin--[acetyl-CoA-carboxylase] ligase [Candidatus Sulfomarinibacteraceae bacterium]|nr:biotin--[acetyl-CoA-carboxylase] ligase [Candidatus Sulfomarinibacteraceae bacterium]
MANDLTVDSVTKSLHTRWLGRHLHVFAEIDSTNRALSQLASEGAVHGTLVISDFQSRGRGRRQRRWLAPRGTSLLFSLLFRPNWRAQRANWLTMIGGLAAAHAVERMTSRRAGLKWPNDVMLATDEGWTKMGGVLLETQLSGDRVAQAILGIGLNVNIPTEQLPDTGTPVTSLLSACGQPVSRPALLATLLLSLELLYEQAAAGNSPRREWNQRLITLGHPVVVSDDNEQIRGVATGTDEWGRLLVRDNAGHTHTVIAADVTLRGTTLPEPDN